MSALRLTGALHLAAAFLTLAPMAAAAQDARRAEQAALFAQLQNAPDDPALALDYVRLSLSLGDVEAAISTLERQLIYRPDDTSVMVELGAAYFRLGSYGASAHYFRRAREVGVSPETDERISDFLAAIEDRSQRSKFSGSVSAGLVASTNANLGVDDRTIRFFGIPAIIGEEFESQGDTGFRIVGGLTHDYDLGGTNLDTWRSEASLYSIRFFEEEQGDVDSLAFSTGPNLALSDSAFGPQARPFAGVRFTRSAGAPFYNEYGGGLDLSDTLSPRWNVFGRGGAGYRDYLGGRDEYDGAVARGLAGVSYAPSQGLALFALALADAEFAESDPQRNLEVGARVAAQYDYAPGFAAVDALWTLTGYAQVSRRQYAEPDPEVDPGRTRRDDDYRVGFAHLFRLGGGIGLQLDVDAFTQDSTVVNYDLESVSGAVSAVFEF
jgi:tetratricopeptide (TPR) repeat protein